MLPNPAFMRCENGSLLEERTNTVAPDFGCGMKPAEEPHATEAARQDVLEEATDQFGGVQGNGLVLARVGIALRPKNLAAGEHLQGAVAGSGFEIVASQVSQRVCAVMAYVVSQRTQEFGIRLALGARASDVLRLVLGHGLRLAGLGLGLGLALTSLATPLLANFLYGVSPFDPVVFCCIPLMLAVVALSACGLPARRAARVDPMVALRYE